MFIHRHFHSSLCPRELWLSAKSIWFLWYTVNLDIPTKLQETIELSQIDCVIAPNMIHIVSSAWMELRSSYKALRDSQTHNQEFIYLD